jgi:transcriptional regulator with XRE-family HTH domain
MDTDIQIKVGKKIRELRTARGLSQEDLADIAGIHWSYVGQIERGKRNLTILCLYKFAKAFNISLSELLDHI